MTASSAPEPVDRLNAAFGDRYRLERELGKGGMATVFLAEDPRQGRRVAVKILRPDLAQAVIAERFLREIQIEARLAHPNIITLLDSGVVDAPPDPPRPYYVMPWVQGESLRQRLQREGSLPVDEATRIIRDVAAALDYAHHEGVIHRDIKPENILLVGEQAVVADFGIARVLSASGTTASATSGGMAVGTPHYMSPEQWAADPRLDGRTDIYSLGCVLYEMLGGEPPFTGPTLDAIRARHAQEPPRPLSTIRRGVPDHVVDAVERAIAKTPADRFRTAGELAAALEGEPFLRLPRRRRRTRWLLAGAAAAAAAVAAWALFVRSAVAVDANRFVVIPFQESGEAGGTDLLLGGDAVAREVRTALGRWEDITVVGSLALGDILSRRAAPQSLRDGLTIARDARAGYLIWGTVRASGDTTYMQTYLYDVARRGAEVTTHQLALVAGPLHTQFAALTDLLMANVVGRPASVSSAAGTTSMEALRAFARGDSAAAAWNLDLAETWFRRALDLDPEYPQANLRYAEMMHWLERPRMQWQRNIQAAVTGGERLSPSDRSYAVALQHLVEGRYLESCQRYRELVARDSLDFAAWFGLGECQARDSLVVPDAGSPSRWRFRSSYHASIEAYTRALRLLPSIHLAYQGAAFDRLARALYTHPTQYRVGHATRAEPARFAAFPALDADTLAFVPFPTRDVLAGRTGPPSRFAAVDRNRALLREIAESWMRAYPDRAPPLVLWALALETFGDIAEGPSHLPTALDAVRRVRHLASGREAMETAAMWEVRLLLKTGRFHEARVLADSLLGGTPDTPERAQRLASLAGLTGRVHLAADLLARSADRWTPTHPDLGPVVVPLQLKALARRLLAYAVFPHAADSVRALEVRIRQEVDASVPSPRRSEIQTALLSEPALFAWGALEGPVEPGYLTPAVTALRAGDREGVRRAFSAIDSLRWNMRPGDLSIDGTWFESLVLLAAGDSAAAFQRLSSSLGALTGLHRSLLDHYPQAASLGNMLAVGAQLAAARGDQVHARAWAHGAAELWTNADRELQPVLRALRQLAEE